MRKLALTMILFAILLQLSTTSLQASFGISPADITYEYLRPGMIIEREFLLSRSETQYPARIEIESHVNGANEWIRFEPATVFTMAEGEQTKTMKVIISPPSDARYRSYDGYIIVKIYEGQQGSGVSVVKGVGVTVNLNTSRIDYKRILVRELKIPDFYEGELLRLFIKTENQGNIPASPEKVEITVLDLTGIEIFSAEQTEFEDVEPSDTQEIFAEFSNQLVSGEYMAEVSVDFEQNTIREDVLIFKVVKKDEISEIDEVVLERPINIIFAVIITIVTIATFIFSFIYLKKRKINHKDL